MNKNIIQDIVPCAKLSAWQPSESPSLTHLHSDHTSLQENHRYDVNVLHHPNSLWSSDKHILHIILYAGNNSKIVID